MRNLLKALVVVALVAAPSLAVTNIQVLVSPSTINVGGTAIVTVQVSAPAGVGVASLAGRVTATGTGAVSSSAFAFAAPWDRPLAGSEPKVVGATDGAGGWANFGSGQITQLMNDTSATYGNNVFVTFATFTVTGATAGTVNLAFVPGAVGGFLPVTTDKDVTIGTNTGAVLTVGGSPNQPPVVTMPANSFFRNEADPATNDVTLTATATDDGQVAPLTLTWSKVSSSTSGLVSFESGSAAATRVRFSRNGVYVLKLTAFDGALTTTGTVTVTVASCDVDGNGIVNGTDKSRLLAVFGKTSVDTGWNPLCDFDNNLIINGTDKSRLLAAFGKTYTFTAYPTGPAQ